jgi:hypothetical protein
MDIRGALGEVGDDELGAKIAGFLSRGRKPRSSPLIAGEEAFKGVGISSSKKFFVRISGRA